MLVVLHTKSGVSYKRSLFLKILSFLTIKVSIKGGISFFFIVGVCCTRALLLHMCYSVSRYVLETHYMGWLDRIMSQILRVSFQLPLVIGGSHPHLNGAYVRFRSPPFLSFGSSSVISLHLVCGSCDFLLSFDRLPHFKVHPSSIMSFCF